MDFPDYAFYQCGIHPKMGGYILTTTSDFDHQNVHIPTIQVTEKMTGLVSPTELTYAPGDPDHYYVADQIGVVYRVTKSTNLVEIFLDVRSYIPQLRPAYDERGLLGLAFHPGFVKEGANKGRFFVFYSSAIFRPQNITMRYQHLVQDIDPND